jgi:hypothetical protein
MKLELLNYLVDYINEELDRHKINQVDIQLLIDAIEAYEGGAR